MKSPGILLLNLLIMVGYSILFMILGEWVGSDIIGIHWGVLAIHIIALFILGIVALFKPETKKVGRTIPAGRAGGGHHRAWPLLC